MDRWLKLFPASLIVVSLWLHSTQVNAEEHPSEDPIGLKSKRIQTPQDAEPVLWALTWHNHQFLNQMRLYGVSVLSKGRVQVYRPQPGVTKEQIPYPLRSWLKPIKLSDLEMPIESMSQFNQRVAQGAVAKNLKVENLLKTITQEGIEAQMKEMVSLGRRTNQKTFELLLSKLVSYGYEPKHDYNIEAYIKGKKYPNELVIIEAHMDTVAGTVGADDNASGLAALLEIARMLSGEEFERSILFLITEDEERGLLGAKRKVRELKNEGRVDDVKFVINMDMIGYNENGLIDLESQPQFEEELDWMADQVRLYTSLQPNKVLFAWGGDHLPFIEAGIPCLMTIEHWKTHTPCWHRSCDTMETINVSYVTEVARLNGAAIALKAKLVE